MWKPLHYAAEEFFRPTHLSSWLNGTGQGRPTDVYMLHVSHDAALDGRSSLSGAVDLSVLTLPAGEVVLTRRVPVHLTPGATGKVVFAQALGTLLPSNLCGEGGGGGGASNCFLLARLSATSIMPATQQWSLDNNVNKDDNTKNTVIPVISTTVLFPQRLVHASLETGAVDVTVTSIPTLLSPPSSSPSPPPSTFNITLVSPVLMPYVVLESTFMGRFSSNLLLLLPHRPVSVLFTLWEESRPVTKKRFAQSMTVKCLNVNVTSTQSCVGRIDVLD